MTQPQCPLTTNELKDVFFSLKTKKNPGYDEVSFNVIRHCFTVLYKPLLHIFNISIEKVIFPNNLKIARVTAILRLAMKKIYETIDQSPSFRFLKKYLKKLCMIGFTSI